MCPLLKKLTTGRSLSVYTPPGEDDKGFHSEASSFSPPLSWNRLDFQTSDLPASGNWPSIVNPFTYLESWESHEGMLLYESTSPGQKRGIAAPYSSTELTSTIGVSNAEQLNSSLAILASPRMAEEPMPRVPEPKPRAKRRTIKPMLKAPNPRGRAGKLRCALCRYRRQGVNSRLWSE